MGLFADKYSIKITLLEILIFLPGQRFITVMICTVCDV